MTATKLQIWNMALRHLGIGIAIADVNENTGAAAACRAFYDFDVEEVLRDAPWPFATRFAALVEIDPIPAPYAKEWDFAYAHPANCVFFRRILNGIARQETPESRIPFRIVESATGTKTILTDYPDNPLPIAEYTHLQTDETKWHPDFAKAVSFLLAFHIGPSLAQDRTKLIDRAERNYYFEISKAKSNAYSEEVPDQPVDSEFVRSRR